MSGMLRLTEAQLHARVQASNRGTPPDVVAFVEATGLSEAVDGSKAKAARGGTNAAVVGEEGRFVVLDYPISVNRYWRNFKGRMVVSAEATKYKRQVQMIYGLFGGKHYGDVPVTVEFKLHPKTTKTGEASKTRMDLDNCVKVLLDALQGAAFANDKQVVKLVGEIAEPMAGGALSVRVTG